MLLTTDQCSHEKGNAYQSGRDLSGWNKQDEVDELPVRRVKEHVEEPKPEVRHRTRSVQKVVGEARQYKGKETRDGPFERSWHGCAPGCQLGLLGRGAHRQEQA